MRGLGDVQRLDPVNMADADRVASRPIFDELKRVIVAVTPKIDDTTHDDVPIRLREHHRVRGPAMLSALVAVGLIIVGLVVAGGNAGLTHPITTASNVGHPFPVASKGTAHKAGTWRLVDDLLTGTWQQNTSGPPPGYLACPSVSACYVMSGHYPSANAGAPLLSESLYVSSDLGTTWSALPMPSGFAPTSSLACSDASDCAAGGTYNGQPVLLTTQNGGHSFTIDPLPGGVGKLYALSCPAVGFCGGLVAAGVAGINGIPVDATFVSTSDGGSSFVDAPIASSDSMQSIACSTNLDCTVIGTNDAFTRTTGPRESPR